MNHYNPSAADKQDPGSKSRLAWFYDLDWSKAIPGLATAVVSAIAPTASINALANHPDARIWETLSEPLHLGVVDLQNQMAGTFASLAIAIVTGIAYLLSPHQPKRLKIFSGIGALFAFSVFIYVFFLGGLGSVHLQAYVPAVVERPLRVHMPPATEILTVIRSTLVVYGIALTALAMKSE